MTKHGKFISIEGGDGAGKSTQLDVISKLLDKNKISHLMTREPGGTPLGEMLREVLLGKGDLNISDDSELLLMFAARAEHIHAVIRPALAQGKWIVSDRFVDASFAYQGARGIALDRIETLSKWSLQGLLPDLTLFFDLPIEQGLARTHSRGEQDRFEMESLHYKKAVQAIYQDRAKADPTRIKRIDASGDVAMVSKQVKQKLQGFIDAS